MGSVLDEATRDDGFLETISSFGVQQLKDEIIKTIKRQFKAENELADIASAYKDVIKEEKATRAELLVRLEQVEEANRLVAARANWKEREQFDSEQSEEYDPVTGEVLKAPSNVSVLPLASKSQ